MTPKPNGSTWKFASATLVLIDSVLLCSLCFLTSLRDVPRNGARDVPRAVFLVSRRGRDCLRAAASELLPPSFLALLALLAYFLGLFAYFGRTCATQRIHVEAPRTRRPLIPCSIELTLGLTFKDVTPSWPCAK